MHIFFITILSFINFTSCYSQGNNELKDAVNSKQPMEDTSNTEYVIPKTDFILFNLENKKGLYTGKINFLKLQKACQYARFMGRIPPIGIVYFDKGYQSSFFQVFTTDFATEIKYVTLKSETFNNLGDYENKRDQLLSLKNNYIVEQETIGYNKYIYVLIQDVDKCSGLDEANEERLYSKLTDLTKKVYKGDALDYYFQGFERFDDKETFSTYVDVNGHSFYRLKFYYYDLGKDIELKDVFTKNDCKRILGRDYILKSYSAIRNEEYLLTWYEF